MIDWSLYPNFSEKEFACKHTGECHMQPAFLELMQNVRTEYGKPMFISSGFRSILHPIETTKAKPGEHTHGLAADILCHGPRAIILLQLFLKWGVTRIGLHQKGNVNARFIHVGIADKFMNDFPGAIWTY